MRGYRELYGALRARMPSPFEADQLFAHVTGRKSHELPLLEGQAPPEREVRLLEELCSRRLAGQPLQYLLEEWEFYGLSFSVGEGVLIPRADTELLVDKALDWAGGLDAPPVLDLCSGSGAVAVALAHELPGAQVTAVELSGEAFAFLERNIARNGVAVRAVRADIAAYRPEEPQALITANPPYIPSGEIGGLQAEVGWEPRMALDGGIDGLDFYRLILGRYPEHLRPGGGLLVEVGIGQADRVAGLMAAAGLVEVEQFTDLCGVARVVAGRRG